jgi:hypothetical protein
MSRPTDSYRGACIALDMALQRIHQPDLFGEGVPLEVWERIRDAAYEEIDDSIALTAAQRGAYAR